MSLFIKGSYSLRTVTVFIASPRQPHLSLCMSREQSLSLILTCQTSLLPSGSLLQVFLWCHLFLYKLSENSAGNPVFLKFSKAVGILYLPPPLPGPSSLGSTPFPLTHVSPGLSLPPLYSPRFADPRAAPGPGLQGPTASSGGLTVSLHYLFTRMEM